LRADFHPADSGEAKLFQELSKPSNLSF
jgi:hypothetical protein